jgi:hypothetical protein
MKDIKYENRDESLNKQLKYECISDKIYFENNYRAHILTNKCPYVPRENILE